MTSKKAAALQMIIDEAIESIPNASVEIYDPREGLSDAVSVLKSVYTARLQHYIVTKEESVAFASRLAKFLKNEYPRKSAEKRRKKRSPEANRAAKANGHKMWVPGGVMFNKQSESWQQEDAPLYKAGGSKHHRLNHADVKAIYDKWVAANKTAKGKTTAKK
jgi:hypothetical protein